MMKTRTRTSTNEPTRSSSPRPTKTGYDALACRMVRNGFTTVMVARGASLLQGDSQLVQLFRIDRRRRLRHQVLRPRGLREGDHVAQRFGARHHHDQAIEAEGDAA